MAQLESILKLIQEEDVASSSSASEALLKKIGGAVNYLIQNSLDYVGKFEATGLTEAQFATLKGYDHTAPEPLKKWVLLKGQSIAGSKYAEITGKTTLPNAVSTGAFPGQASSKAQLLTYEESQNKAHNHSISFKEGHEGYGNVVEATAISPLKSVKYYVKGWFAWATSAYSMSTEGGAVARPNTVRINWFLKINE